MAGGAVKYLHPIRDLKITDVDFAILCAKKDKIIAYDFFLGIYICFYNSTSFESITCEHSHTKLYIHLPYCKHSNREMEKSKCNDCPSLPQHIQWAAKKHSLQVREDISWNNFLQIFSPSNIFNLVLLSLLWNLTLIFWKFKILRQHWNLLNTQRVKEVCS